MDTLNIVGPGRVGRTLARLWAQSGVFALGDVLAQTEAGARDALAFIGSGRAVTGVEHMRAAPLWMITTPDRSIRSACERIAASGLLRAGDIVFHCSGSLSSGELAAAVAAGAHVASMHPLKTFADPAEAVRTFGGTYCAAEGDAAALAALAQAFERIGARVVTLDAGFKTVYHAASVIVCNYLTALMEVGLRCYERAGIAREAASAMIEPIVRETVDNVMRLGPARALTGPISRGDENVIARHLDALRVWDPEVTALYRELGIVATALAREQGHAELEAIARIEALLRR